jgi:hypothetical protein
LKLKHGKKANLINLINEDASRPNYLGQIGMRK